MKKKNNETPNLEFIAEGINSVSIPEGKLSEFCPHLTYCPRKSLDKDCFYNKFLHCDTARELEKTHPLSKEDKHFLKYRDTGVG